MATRNYLSKVAAKTLRLLAPDFPGGHAKKRRAGRGPTRHAKEKPKISVGQNVPSRLMPRAIGPLGAIEPLLP